MGITTGVRNLLSRVNPFASGMVVLNAEVNPPENKEGKEEEDASKRAIALARSLNQKVLGLYGEHLAEDGKSVDYEGMKGSKSFDDYVNETGGLKELDLSKLEGDEKMALFLNLYNALVIHGMAALGVPSSPLDNAHFFKCTAYQIGEHTFSLDDIEHGILRGNKPHPSHGRIFPEEDPRLVFSVPEAQVDPRLHFALVCGAKSCPPIRIYTPGNVERGLSLAAGTFCQQETTVDVDSKTVTLSKLFQWYGADFGANDKEIVQWIIAVLTREDKDTQTLKGELEAVVNDAELKLAFKPYNWDTNTK